MRVTEYRVVETSTVTDEALTRILNHETRAGWVYDGMTFVPNEASKRPRMAFVIFTREVDVGEDADVADVANTPAARAADG
jgi:hypothetical protein